MQSECTAISPQFICSYAWKQPLLEPATFQRSEKLNTYTDLHTGQNARDAVRSSLPWKAILASRELKQIAADIAETLFSAPEGLQPKAGSRPEILTSSSRTLPGGVDGLKRGLLAPVLPQDAVSAKKPPLARAAEDFLIAA